MMFEESKAMYELYCIDPNLTCTCDDLHICQQCMEEDKSLHQADMMDSSLD